MIQPQFSIIAAAIRDYHYKGFCDNVSKECKVPFEIIFVGDKPPLEPMPSNFHYIYTKVKASQCLEIAARNAKGRFYII